MNPLIYTNIFAKNITTLSQFYIELFGFKEIEEVRSPIFCACQTGSGCNLGFNDYQAHELLGLPPASNEISNTFMMTFDSNNHEEVTALSARAVELGATLVKAPVQTNYGLFHSVLLDPEGNAFRISTMV